MKQPVNCPISSRLAAALVLACAATDTIAQP